MRLKYLDGLRGFAALYVALGHAYSLATYKDGTIDLSLPFGFRWATQWLICNRYGVAVFIVLSGFCLALPPARSPVRTLAGGLPGFVKRRARRILPPYLAALTGVLLILALSHRLTAHDPEKMADLSVGNIITHYLLIHNLFRAWNMALDSPMWSVACEWQIYGLFALILLPVWRRFGTGWCITCGFALGYLPLLVLPARANLYWTHPWYLGLFGLGLAAAEIMVSAPEEYCLAKSQAVQSAIIGAVALGFVVLFVCSSHYLELTYNWITDPIVGLAVAALILLCGSKERRTRWQDAITNVLASRTAVTLGTFSYSFYLIHFPMLLKMQTTLFHHGLGHYSQLLLLFVVGLPVCLATAYVFYLCFERPFMPGHPRSQSRAEIAAIASPAP